MPRKTFGVLRGIYYYSVVKTTTSIISSQPQKRKRNSRSPLTWLREHISDLDIGEDKGLGPRHLNLNVQVIDHYQRLRNGQKSYLPNQWTLAKLSNHVHGYTTHYYAGAGESRKPCTMPMIDVDCKRRGTPEGARAYLLYLRSEECRLEYGISFPSLYIEASTHGRGGHGFFVLDKDELGAQAINDLLLHRLAPLLNRIAQEKSFDIELVEIKGTCPVAEWGEQKYEVVSYKAGTPAKLPREAVSRFDELRNTAVLSAWDLMKLPIPERRANDHQPVGSVGGKHFNEEQLSGVREGGYFWHVAAELMKCHKLRTSARAVIRIEDMAILLMIVAWITRNMNPDGSLPTERIIGLWDSLKADVQRAFDGKRYKVMRDFLSSLGLIDWQDEEYVPGWIDDQGKKHNGKAAKWRFSEELMGMIERAREGKLSSGSGAANSTDNREHPLWEQEFSKSVLALQQLPQTETIVPVPRDIISLYRYNADDLAAHITPFDAIAA